MKRKWMVTFLISLASFSFNVNASVTQEDRAYSEALQAVSPSTYQVATDLLEAKGLPRTIKNFEMIRNGGDETLVFLSAMRLMSERNYEVIMTHFKSPGSPPISIEAIKRYVKTPEYYSNTMTVVD